MRRKLMKITILATVFLGGLILCGCQDQSQTGALVGGLAGALANHD